MMGMPGSVGGSSRSLSLLIVMALSSLTDTALSSSSAMEDLEDLVREDNERLSFFKGRTTALTPFLTIVVAFWEITDLTDEDLVDW
jgi:hypothetical protein